MYRETEKKRRKGKNWFSKQLWLFEGDDPSNTPSPTPPPEPTPDPAPKPDPKPAPTDDKTKEIEELKARAEKAENDLKKLNEEKAAKEEEERQKNLTEAEKRKESEAKAEKLERENAILKARQELGLTDPLYDDVTITGKTPEEIKKNYSDFQKKLEERDKAAGKPRVTTPGRPANPNAPNSNADDDVPTYTRLFGGKRTT